MDIIDLTRSGYVYRWSLVNGYPRCVEDAIPSSDDGALPALQRNAAIRAALPPVAEYEAAQALVGQGEPENGEPRQIQAIDEEGQPIVDDEGRPVMVDNPAWALLPRTVIVTDPETGEETEEPKPRWAAYDAAVALIAAASPVVKAFALWRQPEPAEGEDGRLEWLAAGQLVGAAIDDAAETPLEVDPRPVPEQVERWRIRAILKEDGLIETADAAVAAAGSPFEEFWTTSPYLYRESSALMNLAAAIGLSQAQVFDMLRRAAAIAI